MKTFFGLLCLAPSKATLHIFSIQISSNFHFLGFSIEKKHSFFCSTGQEIISNILLYYCWNLSYFSDTWKADGRTDGGRTDRRESRNSYLDMQL